MNAPSTEKYRRLVWILLPLWFAVALIASAFQIFRATSKYSVHPPLFLGLAVALPVLWFASWFAFSPGFRQFALSLNPQMLTNLHVWRVAGYTFLVLYAHGILPGVFALPAGWGDIAMGASAPFVAKYFTEAAGRKNSFIGWQLLGVTDLLLAITLGVLASPTRVGFLATRITTDALTTLPLSLIPTFAVPLLLIFHFICIVQARHWARGSTQQVGQLRTATP